MKKKLFFSNQASSVVVAHQLDEVFQKYADINVIDKPWMPTCFVRRQNKIV